MTKLYACQGVLDGVRCSQLFEGTAPSKCPICGSDDIKQGIQNLTIHADLFKTIPRKVKKGKKYD